MICYFSHFWPAPWQGEFSRVDGNGYAFAGYCEINLQFVMAVFDRFACRGSKTEDFR